MLAEAHDSLRGLQEQLSQERQLRKEEADNFNQKMVQVVASSAPGPLHQLLLLFSELKAETLGLHGSSEDKGIGET